MNKNPAANRTQLEFKVGNTHVRAAWFIAQHNLEVISGWLTLSMTIAMALQTGNYRVDESVLVGKNLWRQNRCVRRAPMRISR